MQSPATSTILVAKMTPPAATTRTSTGITLSPLGGNIFQRPVVRPGVGPYTAISTSRTFLKSQRNSLQISNNL